MIIVLCSRTENTKLLILLISGGQETRIGLGTFFVSESFNKKWRRLVIFSSIFWTASFRNCILWPFKILWRYWFNDPSKIFSKEQSLLLFWWKLPESYASCSGENFIVSKRVAFRLLAQAVPDPVKTKITIAYPECDIMECTLVVIVFSVNSTWSGGSGIITAVQVLDLVCSPWGLVELRHISHA